VNVCVNTFLPDPTVVGPRKSRYGREGMANKRILSLMFLPLCFELVIGLSELLGNE
jgi:hypothetical protein